MFKFLKKLFTKKSNGIQSVVSRAREVRGEGSFNSENLSYSELIKKLREGEIYVHSSHPESDDKLRRILDDAFGEHGGIYDKYKWYGKFGTIHAGQYWIVPEQTVDVRDFKR